MKTNWKFLSLVLLTLSTTTGGNAQADAWTEYFDVWGLSKWHCPAHSPCGSSYSSVSMRAVVRDPKGPVQGVALFTGMAVTSSGNTILTSQPEALSSTEKTTIVKLAFDKARPTSELVAIGNYEVRIGGKNIKARASRLSFAPNGDAVVDALFVLDSEVTTATSDDSSKTCSDAGGKSVCSSQQAQPRTQKLEPKTSI